MITNFNENSFGSKHKPDSSIQGASKRQKKEEGKLVEVEGVEEWEVEKILNKKKMRGVEKYLVQWKGFTAEGDTWERRENLKNAEELIEEFK